MNAVIRCALGGFFPVILLLLLVLTAVKGAVTDMATGTRELLEVLGFAVSLTAGFTVGLSALRARLAEQTLESRWHAALAALVCFGLLFVVSSFFKPNTYMPVVGVTVGVGLLSAVAVYVRPYGTARAG